MEMKTQTEVLFDEVGKMPYGTPIMGVELGTDLAMGGIEYFGIITEYHLHRIYGNAHHVLIVNVHHPGEENQHVEKVRGAVVWTFTDAKRTLFQMLAEEMKDTAWDEESRR